MEIEKIQKYVRRTLIIRGVTIRDTNRSSFSLLSATARLTNIEMEP
ncbi:hypothetical protein [Spirosoma sp.]